MGKTLIICVSGQCGPNYRRIGEGQNGQKCREYEIDADTGHGEAFWRALMCGQASDDPGLYDDFASSNLSLGLISYPANLPASLNPELLVPCSLYSNPDRHALPPELRGNLADYNDGVYNASNGNRYKDPEQSFAEQAAAARIVREHSQRLAQSYKPEVLFIGFNGLSQINKLDGLSDDYNELYINQVSSHAAAMAQHLAIGLLIHIAEGYESTPPVARIYHGFGSISAYKSSSVSIGEFGHMMTNMTIGKNDV